MRRLVREEMRGDETREKEKEIERRERERDL